LRWTPIAACARGDRGCRQPARVAIIRRTTLPRNGYSTSIASQGAGMIWKGWRDRLIYLAASLFLAWHTIAMMLTPVPAQNVIVQAFRNLFHPYVTLLGIDANWNFFSPIGASYQWRYVIEDADGNKHTFKPITEINWLSPAHRWYEKILQEPMISPDLYGDYFAKFFCRKQAALRPVAITLVAVEEGEFRPQDYLLDKNRTTDAEYLTETPVLRALCPQS
jgi:hypothetical protein